MMISRLMIISFGLFLAPYAQSSALVKKDDVNKTLTVSARMVYSGSAMSQEIVDASTNEIQRLWSENPTNITIAGESYRVIFNVDSEIPKNKRKLKKLKKNDSCAYNFIEILNLSNSWDRSYYAGLGSRNGVFYTSDQLGTSTTAAHEFGHGLMLDHNDEDQLEAIVPGIMFARGTYVRPQFQWTPSAQPGAYGGTLKPHTRKVRSEDIKAIPFEGIKFSSDGLGCIGQGLAEPITTEVTKPVTEGPTITESEEVENEEY